MNKVPCLEPEGLGGTPPPKGAPSTPPPPASYDPYIGYFK